VVFFWKPRFSNIYNTDNINIERANARQHLSCGFGNLQYMGNQLAELQLRILWEEIFKRFDRIQVLEEPKRTLSSFVKGYTYMPVRVTRIKGLRITGMPPSGDGKLATYQIGKGL